MRCFIFGTGRCGSVAVAQAFYHATNYTVAHEIMCPLACYPDCHIEVNPQLRFRPADIVRHHPDALYVWLKRDPAAVIRSYERLNKGEWLNTWWSFGPTMRPQDRRVAAKIAVENMVAQCVTLYETAPKDLRRVVNIETIGETFPILWADLGCEGDLAAAVASFAVPVNTSTQRGDA